MTIYIVKQGDTIASIADQYGVPVIRLMQDNGIEEFEVLVPGETIVITNPVKTYTVQEGDSLSRIAKDNGISLNQLLRNNPYLSDRDYIFPGEELVISYGNKKGKLTTNGYAYPFIDLDILRRTLPFLTYISVFGYRLTDNAEIISVEDSEIIQMAKEYNVMPIMMLSTLTTQGRGSLETFYKTLSDQNLVDMLINNIIIILRRKGYYGVNGTFQFLNEETRQIYENYVKKLTERLKREGFLVFVTISERFIIEADKVTFDKTNLSKISQMTDGLTVLNYNWGYSFGPPGPVVSVYMMKEFLDYIITMIVENKTELGIPIIGYDWDLPYEIGYTKANSLTIDSAIALAGDVGATIQFDEVSQTPYYRYIDNRTGIPIGHIVWFIDARTVNSILDMIQGYGLRGTGIWNIMNYYPQLWTVINAQYEIETLLT